MKEQETNDHRLKQLFGEALGEAPSTRETEAAWQAFSAKHRRKRSTAYWLIPSTVAAILVLTFLWWHPTDTEIQVYASMNVPQETSIEEVEENMIVTTSSATTMPILLTDGTEVILSANSRLEYAKDFTSRHVKLTGEAQFRVAKDSLHPFVVYTEKMQTTVLGTRFNVKSYPSGKPVVTLFQGSVQVDVKHRPNVILKPGEELSLDEEEHTQVALCTDTEKDWVKNEFLFDNLTLADAMREVGAWYNHSVVFRSRELMDERIHFKMSRNYSCEEVLRALEDMQLASFEWKDGKIVVK